MLFGKYRFLIQMKDEAILPYYKGSTFRGVFGHALKKVVCALKRQDCEDCLLRNKCMYTRVFETPLISKMPHESNVSAPPHPFVIEPPLDETREYQKDAMLDCSLVLFGEVNEKLPYFVYAFDQMGNIGIGKRVNGKRGQFTLRQVIYRDRVIYSDADEKLDQSNVTEDLQFPEFHTGPNQEKLIVGEGGQEKLSIPDKEELNDENLRIGITLESPLRLKFENKINAELPFHILTRAMLRRISSLFVMYDNGEPPFDYKGLTERASNVKIIDNNLQWYDWRRYSNRQERSMFMGGMIGSVVYEGKLGEYLHLLDVSSKVHLGKNTSFGLGKIRAREAE